MIDAARKLILIARLPADEIDGYEGEARLRGLFDGEAAAILARRKAVAK